MAVFEVSREDYEIMASILKDGADMRFSFKFKELRRTLLNIGFSEELRGRFKYDGKVVFVFQRGDKGHAAVPYARQDELKQQMVAHFGWTKGTFVERPGA